MRIGITMPRRRSKDLANALRYHSPERLGALAEMSEPYGTISSAQRIAGGDASALDYAAAVPFIGGPARYLKALKAMDKAESAAELSDIRKAIDALPDRDRAAFLEGMAKTDPEGAGQLTRYAHVKDPVRRAQLEARADYMANPTPENKARMHRLMAGIIREGDVGN